MTFKKQKAFIISLALHSALFALMPQMPVPKAPTKHVTIVIQEGSSSSGARDRATTQVAPLRARDLVPRQSYLDSGLTTPTEALGHRHLYSGGGIYGPRDDSAWGSGAGDIRLLANTIAYQRVSEKVSGQLIKYPDHLLNTLTSGVVNVRLETSSSGDCRIARITSTHSRLEPFVAEKMHALCQLHPLHGTKPLVESQSLDISIAFDVYADVAQAPKIVGNVFLFHVAGHRHNYVHEIDENIWYKAIPILTLFNPDWAIESATGLKPKPSATGP